MNDLTPIQAYFSQSLKGKHNWFSWVFGFWLAMVIWIVGQNIVGVAMFGFLANVDPEGVSEILNRSSGDTQAALKAAGLVVLGVLLVLIGTVTYFVGQSKQSSSRKILHIISGICVGISGIGIGYMMSMNNPEDVEVITRNIPKSKGIYVSLLLGFPPMIFGLWIVVRFVHKRAFKTILTAAEKFRWSRLLFSMLVFWAVVGVFTVLGHMAGLNTISFSFDAQKFFGYALISLLLIPLQSATEELVLRGYLNQGLGKYIKNPWIVFVITSGMFAALHLGNPEASEGAANGKLILTMSSYFMFGFFACILTYIDGGLESAIGVHAANNLFASIVLGYDNSALPTPTAFHTTLNPSTDAAITILSMGLVCLIMWKFRAKLN